MKHTLRKSRVAPVAVALAGLLASCDDPQVTVASPPFAEVFELAEVIQLGEDPADSIAEIGIFLERRNGGFIIGDRLLPRVRTYAEDGALEAAFGRFGSGPWEFHRIKGVAEMASGRIVVTSWRNRWLTYLTGALTPDTIVAMSDPVVFNVFAFGPDLILDGPGGDALAAGVVDERGRLHRLVDGC